MKKGLQKRIVAFLLTLAMLVGEVPITVMADTTESIVYDFGRPTTGVESGDTLIGIDDTEVSVIGRVSTSLVGTNWVINNDKTTAPKATDNETFYQRLQTNSTNTAGLVIQKWKSPFTTYIQANFNHTLAFDITVPEAGKYALTLTSNNRNIAMPIDVTVNGTYLTQVAAGTESANVDKTTDLGEVTLAAGTNTVEFKHVGEGTANQRKTIMLRSLTITKVEDSATPTAAPTQSPATSEFTIDFLNSTAGASLNGVVGGVSLDTAQKGSYLVTTSFAGNGWKINTSETNVTLDDDGTTYVEDELKLQYMTIKGIESAMAFRRYKYVAFDFTVPEAGVYEMVAKFEPYGNTALTDWYVNDKSTRLNRTEAGLTGDVSIGQVTLNAGEYANTLYIRNQGSGTHTYLQSVTFKKVEGGATPTAAPTTAPTGTPAPTLAPTATPAPTPVPTPAPTLDPTATQAPFSVSVTTADDSTIYTADGVRFYMEPNTKGANWKVDASTDAKNLVQGTTIAAANRFYYSGTTPSYLQVYASGMTVLAFTAPQGGDYDLEAIVKFATTGGYGDVYVNGNYVGTVDCNQGEDFNRQKLLGVTLYAGAYANTIAFKQAGRSTGTQSYLYFQGFDFTPVTNKAKKTGLEMQIDSTQLYVGDEKQVTTVGKTTNGTFYRLASVGVNDITYTSSDNSVASISTGGLVKALKAGTTTITAHSATLNESTTVLLTVSDVAFSEAEVNVEDGTLIVERDTITLEAKAKFNNGEYAPQKDISVVYESGDEDIITIENDILKAVGEGSTTLTAKVTYKGVTHNAVRTVKVLKYEPPQPFKFDFKTSDQLITRADGAAWYMGKESHGDIWRLNASKTSNGVIGTSPDSLGSLRVFIEEKYTYFRPMTSGKEYVFDFTAPVAGSYDLTANAITLSSGGYGDVYINGVYVGSIDCFADEASQVPFKLLGVKLKAGEYANELKFIPSGASGGTGSYTSVSSFDFSTAENIATLTAIDATADVDAMYVGREEQIDVEAILSNGGLYRIEKSGETLKYETSDANVATVSSTGVITAKGAGEVTITITTSETKLSDTITFSVTDAAYDKVVMNVTEGEEFYVTNERALEVVATLADGTEIAQKDLTITYSSSDENVAKIEDNVLKIVAKGNATITANVKFRVTGETKSDVKNITATTIPLKGITAVTEKTTVQALDKDGVKLIVKGIAFDDTIIEDLVVAGFTSFDYKFTALNPEKLTIDPDGTCHYVSRGDAQVKVEAVIDGVPFECVADVVSSSSKTGRTLYTDEMIEAALYNANNTSWGSYQTKRTEGQIYKYTFYTEEYYDAIPAEGVPRSSSTGTINADNIQKQVCPYCGVNLDETFGAHEWNTDPILYPWKIECPNCYMKFPTNDFELLYKRGLDENGNYNRELALQRNAEAVARGEKDALINEMCPERGATWYVDDGFGYSPLYGTYGTQDTNQFTAVAYYHHLFWYKAPVYHMYFVLYKLRDAYLWTGNEVYGRTGAILLDRIADVYPDYDITKVGLTYSNASGGRSSGKILGSIWEYFIAEYFVDCYDAFYPMYDDPEVIAFLSRKAEELGLENPKNTPDLIRENIENGIVRESLKACYNGDIWGNFGMNQIVAAKAAVVLDTYPETQEALDWLEAPSVGERERVIDPIFNIPYNSYCSNSGGELGVKYVQEIDRDGFGGEISISYNSIWLENSIAVAEVLNRYGAELDLFKDPKFVKMFDSFIHMTLGDGYSLANGDSGETAGGTLSSFATQTMQAYKVLRDPKLAQIYDYYVGGNYKNAYIDMYTIPTQLIVDIQADVAEHGKLELESENLTGYGLAVLRGGKAATKEDQFERRYDTWMYYGRTAHSHAHNDMLQLGIDAYGFNFNPDLGYPEATAKTANRYEWVKNSISHNVVLVDEKEQDTIYTGNPLHFDSTENVKLMDVEASDVYEQTDIYRRTAVTVKYNDDVSYTVDLFRVRGGNHHMYSFHSSSYKAFSSEDIEWVPQINEKGEYVGTYAGPDVPYGPDPNSTDAIYATNPVYPRGYTWLTHVNRGTDKTNDGYFDVNFEQTNFKDQVVNAYQLNFKFHSVNDWTPSSVDMTIGYAPRIAKNERVPGLDYMFIHRDGENLDTLFASVWEPYKGDSYIHSTESIVPTVKSGTETADDVVKVIKVTMKNGRADYIVYATNKDVLYNITDGNVSFDFQGFVGVYTVDYFGNNTFKYINDGTVIGDATSLGAYTGTVVDFTKELAFENSITIKMNEEVEDVSVLNNQYIYIDNTSELTGAFRILEAEAAGENIILHLGNTSIIEDFIDAYDTDGGYTYIIAEGQSFRIPVSMADDTVFSGTSAPAPSGGGSSAGSDAGDTAATDDANVAGTEESTDIITAPGEDSEYADLIIDDVTEGEDEFDDPVVNPEGSGSAEGEDSTEGVVGEPTATPEATGANAGGKKTRNILLGGLGILALLAGFFLILLGKKKDEDEEE